MERQLANRLTGATNAGGMESSVTYSQTSQKGGRVNTILVVDDNEDNVFLLESIVTTYGYDAMSASCGREAIELVKKNRRIIDLVIMDVMMPDMDGLEVTRIIKQDRRTRHIPIILLTAKQREQGDVAKGLDIGADDYLRKPVDSLELLARIRSALRTKSLRDDLSKMNDNLEQIVEERTVEIMLTRDTAIFGFAKLAEYRDPETGGHLERIRNYTKILATELQKFPRFNDEIDNEFITMIYQSSPLHDIGKVGVPDSILLKPGRLAVDEFERMKTHAIIGGDALTSSERLFGDSSFLSMGRDVAYSHHEKWDGSGYPRGLKGDAIPLSARIMALADVFDALVSNRVYKKAMDIKQAHDIILEGEGRHFDPGVVKAFLNVEEAFEAIQIKYKEDK